MQSLSNDETDKALLELEENYINVAGKNKLLQQKQSKYDGSMDHKKLNLNERSQHGESKLSSQEIGTTDLNADSSMAGGSPARVELPKINQRR